ncbi:MAG: spore maturation protein A [Oscillospiraceae bacterium]|nr:spore maturation protein A [Oscillospiraceae bacterium]
MLGKIWVVMVVFSLFCALFSQKTSELSSAVSAGASQGIELVLSIGGMIMLWSGVMEIMKRSGLSEKLARLLTPLLRFLFPSARKDDGVMSDIASNVTANLLGLGNAATPAGIRAAQGLYRLGGSEYATNDLCMLVVINTASLQLIPTTVAAIRASLGAAAPFDIIPAVWFASAVSQCVGIVCAALFSKFRRKSPL